MSMFGKAFLFIFLVMSCKFASGIYLEPNIFQQMSENELKNKLNALQRSAETTTECVTLAPLAPLAPFPSLANIATIAPVAPNNETVTTANGGEEATATGGGGSGGAVVTPDNNGVVSPSKLYALVQHIYAAQARVQLEVNEIKKAQTVANSAQKALEEAANNVRVITSALQSAQESVAAAAVRAQSAQMQLAAHDQLLFTARQKVDALSSQMVGLQAEEGVKSAKNIINFEALLAQLKQPLPKNQMPTPIPPIDKALVEEDPNEDKSVEGDERLSYDDVNY